MTPLEERLQAGLGERYTLVRELGRGGMARVYLAEDTRHHRQVALKLLNPDLASVIGSDRFLREIEVAARLTHPHILPLFDSGDADGLLWYAMPYMPGQSLQDRIEQGGPLAVDEAVPLATQVAQALDYAHRQGVVHRDIKPSNILLHEGQALVADFGIALALGEVDSTRLTGTGLSLGTPLYMSPEQASGDKRVDGRTDLYALGCVVYEMLTGEPPFSGGSPAAVVARIMTEKPPTLASRRSDLPRHIEQAVARALAKDPAERFATGREFAAALQGQRVAAVTAPTRRSLSRIGSLLASRGARLALGGMGLALALVALWQLELGPFAPPPLRPVTLERLTTTGAARSPAVSPDGSTVAYFANRCPNRPLECPWDLVWQDVAGGPPLKLLENLAGARLSLSSAKMAWSDLPPLVRWLDQSTLLIPGNRLWTTEVVSRTGGSQRVLHGIMLGLGADDTIYTTTDGGRVLEVAARKGTVVDTIIPPGRPISVEGSADGRWLAMVVPGSSDQFDRSTMLLVTDRRGAVRDTIARRLWLRSEVRWAPTSDALYYWRVGASLTQARLVRRQVSRASGRGRGGEAMVVDRSGLWSAPSFDMSRDGRRVALEAATAQEDYTILRLTHEGRPDGPPRVLRTVSRWVHSDLTPDGTHAIFWEPEGVGDSLTYRVYVSPTESLALRPVGPNFPVASIMWRGYDSRHVTVHYQDDGRLRWTTIDLASGEISGWKQVPHPDGSLVTVAGGTVWLSGDGRSLSFFDATGVETPIREWAAQQTIGSPALAVSPDGRTVVIEGIPDTGRVSVSANLPGEIFQLSVQTLSLNRVAWAASTPWAGSWGVRWLRGGAIMGWLDTPPGTRFWGPDGKGRLRVQAELPPGFDWTPNSADGRVMMSPVTRWTGDILTARLEPTD